MALAAAYRCYVRVELLFAEHDRVLEELEGLRGTPQAQPLLERKAFLLAEGTRMMVLMHTILDRAEAARASGGRVILKARRCLPPTYDAVMATHEEQPPPTYESVVKDPPPPSPSPAPKKVKEVTEPSSPAPQPKWKRFKNFFKLRKIFGIFRKR